jgi:hypothetical protein
MNVNTISTKPNTQFNAMAQHQLSLREASGSNLRSIRNTQSTKKRWLCSVAENVKLSANVDRGINISGNGKYSQYELVVKLLKAETCDVIYFDCRFSSAQIGILKMLQLFSSTELVHARLAMQFDQAAV